MSYTHQPRPEGMDDLTRRIDDLPVSPGDGGFDLSDFIPAGTQTDDPAAGYGTVRNFANGYGRPGTPVTPSPADSEIPAYNADFRQEIIRDQKRRKQVYRDYGEAESKPGTMAERRVKARKKRRHGCGCGCTTVLMLLAAVIAAAFLLIHRFFEVPATDVPIGVHKEDTATILLCGTDKDGTRTDTMMLIYLSGEERRVGLLSLPRDTLTHTTSGNRAKLNSAYGRNGCGTEGMENLLEYVADIIGYEPDGYILVDMELVPEIVDLMGGLDVNLDHHIRIHNDGEEIYVPAGQQHLDGRETLAALRYRAGYYNADLGRIQVQRMIIKAAMEQWVTPANLAKLPDVMTLIQERSLTNLNSRNLLWAGKTILLGLENFQSDTLPGYADMLGGASYYILYRDQVAELVDGYYNPYTTPIDADDLNIVEN